MSTINTDTISSYIKEQQDDPLVSSVNLQLKALVSAQVDSAQALIITAVRQTMFEVLIKYFQNNHILQPSALELDQIISKFLEATFKEQQNGSSGAPAAASAAVSSPSAMLKPSPPRTTTTNAPSGSPRPSPAALAADSTPEERRAEERKRVRLSEARARKAIMDAHIDSAARIFEQHHTACLQYSLSGESEEEKLQRQKEEQKKRLEAKLRKRRQLQEQRQELLMKEREAGEEKNDNYNANPESVMDAGVDDDNNNNDDAEIKRKLEAARQRRERLNHPLRGDASRSFSTEMSSGGGSGLPAGMPSPGSGSFMAMT